MDFTKKPPVWVSASDACIEPLINTEQAAILLRIHPKTLQRMARRGQIKGYQLGKLWRFRASDLSNTLQLKSLPNFCK